MSEIAWVDHEQVERVAALLKANPPKKAELDFYSDFQTGEWDAEMYPDVHHPNALEFFFFGCLHDYGFWYGHEEGYDQPLYGEIYEDEHKGSELLWRLCKFQLDQDASFFDARNLATVSPYALSDFLEDDAHAQWPDFDGRLGITRAWGQWLLDTGRTPESIVAEANGHTAPLGRFKTILKESPFGWDSMLKKGILLAMVLDGRPEKFLDVRDPQHWEAIVDYHLMRVSLRKGTVRIAPEIEPLIAARAWIQPPIERAIREATKEAVERLVALTGFEHAVIDAGLWRARRYCPEMRDPECYKCIFDSVCDKRTKLFQPIKKPRTRDY